MVKNIVDYFAPMREKRKYYEERPELVDELLKTGTEKARKTAKETMKKVKKAMKLDYFEIWKIIVFSVVALHIENSGRTQSTPTNFLFLCLAKKQFFLNF